MIAYLQSVVSFFTTTFTESTARVLHPQYHKDYTVNNRVLVLLGATARSLLRKPDSSIDQLIEVLVQDSVLLKTPANQYPDNEARHVIFCLLGWLTLLYRPALPTKGVDGLSIDSQSFPFFAGDTQPITQCSRPFLEVVQVFRSLGKLLDETSSPQSEHCQSSITLRPSNFDAAILTTIGELTICWTDAIGSHLEIDIINQKLFVFRIPSFLRIQAGQGAYLPT